MVLCVLAFAAVFADLPVVSAQEKPGEKPSITVVLPSIDELFKDLRLVFELVDDSRGYTTLK
jgi:hypothetical protein